MEKKIKTQLNKKYRIPLTVNARRYKGDAIPYVSYEDENGRIIEKTIDTDSNNGGTLTPFNIQCNVSGAPAIRTIVLDGDNTIVVFADGDRVALKRHESDANDPVTAVMWALSTKVFGCNLVRQIRTALKNRAVDTAKRRSEKAAAKAVS